MSRTPSRTALSFPRTSVPHGDRKVAAYLATCCRCDAVETILATGHSASLPPEVTAQKLRQRGWSVNRRCYCPACA